MRSQSMIVSFWHLAAVTCVLLSATIAGCLMANGRTESEAAVGANLEDIVHRLAEQESPVYLEALPPDESVIKNHLLAEPPAAVLEKAKQWMKRVIKDEWLPEDLAKRLFAIKDWTRIERSAMEGAVRWSEVGDYICAQYEVDDHQLMIQENGLSVSLRVDLPEGKDAAVDVEVFITQCIVRFLNVPAGYASQVHYDLKEDDGVYHGTALVEDVSAEHWWWRRLRVLTDGHVFFVSAAELDGTAPSPRAKAGLPDRF